MAEADTEQLVRMVALTSKLPVLVSACATAVHSSKSAEPRQRKWRGMERVFIGASFEVSKPSKRAQ
jgi:hypothetical protein